ncbi:GDP-mannose transporter GONST3-like [Chenopodium quinoa]|uniref:Sugar phosphate transporter domain-containing protein n=1 Tax=Chenopodium quinoa TaxID=63459 RepID=A0A803M3Z2_CHEQI|nr:GDP-mannose transporter GONST3-like [Chenopodium quinoa]
MSGDVENPKSSEVNKNADVIGSSVPEVQVTWYSIFCQQVSIYGVAAGYCLSASLLSIINKWAVMKFPYPGALTALQYFTSAAGVLVCGQLKWLEHDPLDLMTMWRFLPAAIIFYLSLFTNSELLLHANVDTFIVFRSVVPIFVAIGETLFLHQPWPSLKTWASLVTIFGGSVIYVMTDYQFTVMAYTWALAYLVSMSIDFVYIKHVVMTIGLNTWGLVLYNNLEALLLFPLELFVMGELKKIKHDISDESEWHSFSVILPVGLSCLFGLSISFFGFSCRKAISATGFTVLGIVNKLLTVVINLVIWDKHSTFVGTVGLLVCMLGGVMYQQSTSKPKPVKAAEPQESQEEEQKLLEMQSNIETDHTLEPNSELREGK